MKKLFNEKYGRIFYFFEVLSAIGVMGVTFIFGVYVEQFIFNRPDEVNFRQVLPWLCIFVILFGQAFNLFAVGKRRIVEISYSIFLFIILENLACIALPFFYVLYHINIGTLSIILTIQFCSMYLWLIIMRKIYFACNLPHKALVIASTSDSAKRYGNIVKIHSKDIGDYCAYSYEEPSILNEFDKYDSIFVFDVPSDFKEAAAAQCYKLSKNFYIAPGLYELIIENAKTAQFNDILTLKCGRFGLTSEQAFVKRTLDIIVSFIGIIISAPLVAIFGIIIKKEDGGPVLFKQERVTKDGRKFMIYKLRTMAVDAEKISGPVLASDGDVRITKIGKILRNYRLDEITQLINVFKGDMSLVGPRPEREYFINQYLKEIPEFTYRLKVRAGITGFAHVLGKYTTSPAERIRLDLFYIQNYSLFMDFKIILETIRIVLDKNYSKGVSDNDSRWL